MTAFYEFVTVFNEICQKINNNALCNLSDIIFIKTYVLAGLTAQLVCQASAV